MIQKSVAKIQGLKFPVRSLLTIEIGRGEILSVRYLSYFDTLFLQVPRITLIDNCNYNQLYSSCQSSIQKLTLNLLATIQCLDFIIEVLTGN